MKLEIASAGAVDRIKTYNEEYAEGRSNLIFFVNED